MLSGDMGYLTQPPKPAIGAARHPIPFLCPRRFGGACIQPRCRAGVKDPPHGGGTLSLAMSCARSISLEPPARPGPTSAALPRSPRQALTILASMLLGVIQGDSGAAIPDALGADAAPGSAADPRRQNTN